MVLIPGSYTHHSIWEPVIRNSDINANILLVELPGFGKSTPKIADGRIEEFTALILELIDSARISRFFIGGHSIGGMIAIEMLDHAEERLDGIISCEGWTHASVEKNAFGDLNNQILTDEQIALRTYYGSIARENWTEDEIHQYGKIWRKWGKGHNLLKRASIPILEIWGDRGLSEKPGRDKLQIPNKKNIELIWLENCGHSLLVQYPDRIGEIISKFVLRNGQSAK